MAVALEQEWPLVLDVRERDVGCQPDRGRKPRVLDVVRSPPEAHLLQPVLVRGTAAHACARLTHEGAQDPHEHRRLEEAVVQVEAGGEVEELELPAGPAEEGAEHVRVLDVLLLHDLGVRALHGEDAASLAVEKRPEDEARVGPGPAEPFHRAVAEQRVVRAVADDAETVCHRDAIRGGVGCTYLTRPGRGRSR